MGRPSKGAVVRHQHFAPPDGAIRAQPRAIEGETDYRAVGMILGHAGGDMGMVMLHLDAGDAVQFPGITGAHIARMHVAGHDLRIDVQNAL